MKEAGDIGHAELMCALDQYEYLGVLTAVGEYGADGGMNSLSRRVFAVESIILDALGGRPRRCRGGGELPVANTRLTVQDGGSRPRPCSGVPL